MAEMVPTENVPALIKTGGSARAGLEIAPAFKPGDAVVAANINPTTHTRLPRYVRGKIGTVQRDHGVFVFNDTRGASQGDRPQHVYSVAFDAAQLWGPGATSRDKLYIDMFEDYLTLAG